MYNSKLLISPCRTKDRNPGIPLIYQKTSLTSCPGYVWRRTTSHHLSLLPPSSLSSYCLPALHSCLLFPTQPPEFSLTNLSQILPFLYPRFSSSSPVHLRIKAKGIAMVNNSLQGRQHRTSLTIHYSPSAAHLHPDGVTLDSLGGLYFIVLSAWNLQLYVSVWPKSSPPYSLCLGITCSPRSTPSSALTTPQALLCLFHSIHHLKTYDNFLSYVYCLPSIFPH